ncbi:Protein of unknown function DUF2894 [Comamonadaceae bacterium]
MTEATAPADQLLATLDALRSAGRQALDPVRFRYLETLAQRLPTQSGAVQHHLCTALGNALADFERRCAIAPAAPSRVPLRRAGLNSLKALNTQLRMPQADSPTGAAPTPACGVPEMKSVQQFKQAWGRMKVQDQVGHALTQGPANAGPLNSHRLVLRTLGLMQDLSPAYLHHFMSHLDTLLQLDALTLPQAPKAAKPAKATKSTKPVARKTAVKK